jgi:glycosyltransferase involved in cell wall biosynthesis
VKINEYLAAGKPVVATNLPAICDFNKQHKVLETVLPQPKSFLEAIEHALDTPNGQPVLARRREIAALSDWRERIEAMCELIGIKLQSKVTADQ